MLLQGHRLDKKCGASAISASKKCTKPTRPTALQIAGGSTAALGTLAALALMTRARGQQRRQVSGASPRPQLGSPGGRGAAVLRGGPGGTGQLPRGRSPRPAGAGSNMLAGSAPARALLPPAARRLGRTARMRANTQAAIRNAEGRIAQTAREEVRRLAQIGNTMAAAGEATGMATKMTMRELRLRAEKLRRRYEPGYRKTGKRQGLLSSGPVRAQLQPAPEGGDAALLPIPRLSAPARRRMRRDGASLLSPLREDVKGSRAAAVEEHLRAAAKKKGLTGEAADEYVYGALNNMKLMKGSKLTRKGSAKITRSKDTAQSAA